MTDNAALKSALDVMLQDENGDFTYSNEKALFGYLDIGLRMPRFAGRVYAEPPNFDVNTLGNVNAATNYMDAGATAIRAASAYIPALPTAGSNGDGSLNRANKLRLEFTKVALMNFRYLKVNNPTMTDDDAMLVSHLRARWVVLGAFYNTAASRIVTYDEVVDIPVNDPAYVDIHTLANPAQLDTTGANAAYNNAFIAYITANKDFTPFVVKYAETIWQISEFVFRVRGHHYKTAHDNLIDKAWTSVSEGNIPWPARFSKEHAFRTAIHPFGVKALPIMAYKWLAYGKMGNGLILRLSGAPNGFAAITTAAAGIKVLASETWYTELRSKYKEQLETIEKMATLILNQKYNYHLSARLYGATVIRTLNIDGKTYTMSEADQIVGAIAPIIQGFIEWAKDRLKASPNSVFSFGNARVLEKRAATNPLMAERMKEILEYTVQAIVNAKSTREAIDQVFVVEAEDKTAT